MLPQLIVETRLRRMDREEHSRQPLGAEVVFAHLLTHPRRQSWLENAATFGDGITFVDDVFWGAFSERRELQGRHACLWPP
jgi:hypothetical protein